MDPTHSGIDNRTRLEILRLVAELEGPVGAETLVTKLADRGIEITSDGVRWHLRVLDEQGFTNRVGTRGRVLTERGWRELRRSLVDARMTFALARTETLAHQVTFDVGSGSGEVVGALTIFPADHLPTVLSQAARVCRSGLCVSDRVALLREGEKFGASLVPPKKMGLVTVSTATIDGLFLSRGVSFRPTFGGIVEMASWRPYRFVDVLEYGRGSRDPVEVLIREGSTRVHSIPDRGRGFLMADVREVVGVARERARRLLDDVKKCGLGGLLAMGHVGQPVLGVPVQQHTFGIALVAGVNPTVAAYETGVSAEFHCSETVVDYASLQPIQLLLEEAGAEMPVSAGSILAQLQEPDRNDCSSRTQY